MKKQKNFQLATIGVLVFAVLFMAIGFAAYSQTLTINGTVNVAKSKWSVHYSTAADDYQLEEGSVEATSKTITNTDITFEAKLAKPTDHHTFTVKVVNDGTFDAKLTSFEMSSLTAEQQKYLTYSVKYGSENAWTQSMDGLDLKLPAGGSTTVMVDVKYVEPANAEDLPAEDVEVVLSAKLNYDQD